MSALILGDEKASPEALETMKSRGGRWAAYQNMDLGSRGLGHLQFLQFGGPESTFEKPPARMPDTQFAIGWRYLLVGEVNLETGEIKSME